VLYQPVLILFFFSSRRRHTRSKRDWSSDVCSSDLPSMYHPHLSVADEVRKAGELGFRYLELSPRPDFHEWHHYPKVDRHQIAERSEERRVGKEGRARSAPGGYKKKAGRIGGGG